MLRSAGDGVRAVDEHRAASDAESSFAQETDALDGGPAERCVRDT
jgi:hypothetical protein